MERLLELKGYDILEGIWDDEEHVCNYITNQSYLGPLSEAYSDIAKDSANYDDESLYETCKELMNFSNENAIDIDIEDKNVAEILQDINYEYYMSLLHKNTNNIIYNSCVIHINDILRNDEKINYSKENLEEFLGSHNFNASSWKSNILEDLENHMSEVNMDNLTNKMEDLTDKIENFINDLGFEEEDINIYFHAQRVSENKLCISIDITDED